MNTNFSSITGGSGLSGMLDSLVMSPAAGAASAPDQADGAGQFGNLLDLISDMQVADESGHGQEDFLNERSASLFDPALLSLAVASQQVNPVEAQLRNASQAMPKEKVGQPVAQASGGTVSASELLVNAQEFDTLSKAGLLEKGRMQSLDNAESARIWAAAFAMDDIKSVSVEKLPEPVKEQALPVELFTKQPIHEEIASTGIKVSSLKESLPFKAAEKVSQGTEPTVENKIVAPKAAAISAGARGDSASDEGFKPFVREDKPREVNAEKSVKGSEFLLTRATAEPATSNAPALNAAAKLGQSGDRRISADAVDFVADKVDALRSQGGGKLRVELNPGNLGTVEIRVSMQRGQMKVELLAERPETLKALGDVRHELTSKLEAIAPAKLELNALQGRSVQANEVAIAGGDLLKMRGAEALKASADVARSASSANSHVGGVSSSSTKSGGDSFESSGDFMSRRENLDQRGQQRQERREKALQDWEDFSHRKSA